VTAHGGDGKTRAMRSDIEYLRFAVGIAAKSRANGNHPFGALLVGPEGDVLLSSGNTYARDRGLGHAEANVVRAAAQQYDPIFLERCTLVTSVEPCCMCAGACYWAGIGTVVYGLSERRLAELTGDNPENLTLDLSCHQVFAAGRRHVAIRGPFPELEEEIVNGHKHFW
jgi:tRNA(Arg) A34 adenosine deaminase TadA